VVKKDEFDRSTVERCQKLLNFEHLKEKCNFGWRVLRGGRSLRKGEGKMATERLLIIGAGGIAMMLLMLIRQKNEFPHVQKWKMVILSIALTVTGVLGTMIMFFIESGHFGGTSFYGAVLFVPILMIPAVLLKIPYRDILNLCAPAECLMLSIMKIDCLMSNCCYGRYIPAIHMVFPSQIVEGIAGLLIMGALLLIAFKKKNASLYPWYLIIYGAVRYCLNGYRFGLTPFMLGLSNGHFWSVVSVVIGLIWLISVKNYDSRKNKNVKRR